MDKDTINDIAELISAKMEQIYNTAVTMANLRLLNHYKDKPTEWAKKQRNEIGALKRDVNTLVKKEVKPLFSTIEKALLLAYALTRSNSKNKALNDEELANIRVELKEQKNENFDRQLKALQIESVKTLNKLPSTIEQMQKKNIIQVGSKYSIMKEPDVNKFYNEIVEQGKNGLQNAPPIIYKNGRKMPLISYADMKNRTMLQEYTNKAQLEAGRNAGLIFWLVSSFGDSAKDHVDFQAKIYIDRDWESMVDEETRKQVQDYISANDIRVKQDVEEGEPYLTTRPNCRHRWMPMNTEEVLGGKSTNAMLKENNMLLNGKYEQEKANARDKLRYEERLIRKYKLQAEETNIRIDKTPVGELREEEKKKLQQINANIKVHQRKARELVKDNSTFLEREYTRENPRLIKSDLGYKYYSKYYKA
jgi:hypothetical protein